MLLDTNLFCPICKRQLLINPTEVRCTTCQTSYPLLADCIPVLTPNPTETITRNYIEYTEYHRIQPAQQRANLLPTAYTHRPAAANTLSVAYAHNATLVEEIISSLLTHVTVASLTSFILHPPTRRTKYLFDSRYLYRDWSGLPESEAEIALIMRHLLPRLPATGPILFLGAGLGRIACEVAARREAVYAIDNSVAMGYLYNKAIAEPIEFYDINFKNIERAEQLAIRYSTNERLVNPIGKKNLTYIIGSAANLPFPDKYFAAIVSVYFTDVLPLSAYIGEISRTLADSAAFIHYGPLEYHFDNPSQMLALDELIDTFRLHRLELQEQDKVASTHCKSPVSGGYKLYTNWIMSFRKEVSDETLTADTVISIEQSILFSLSGQITNSSCQVSASIGSSQERNFEVNEALIEILKLLDGTTNFRGILQRISTTHGSIDNIFEAQLSSILVTLKQKGFLQFHNPEAAPSNRKIDHF